MKLKLGSRGSTLALWQAQHVQALLRAAEPELEIEIEVLHTTGDRITDVPLAMIGDKGLFTKEVDNAVLEGRVHCAVHSFKDVPTRLPDGLELAAVLERDDPRDVYLPAPGQPQSLSRLPAGSRVGTSSLRRRALLLNTRPDLVIEDLRGNLDTRIAKLQTQQYDAIILAFAGLRRIGRTEIVGETLDPPAWLPAAGQGALAVVCRADDHATSRRLQVFDHAPTRAATAAERSFLATLEGGCQIPIGALAGVTGDDLTLYGLVASTSGDTVIRGAVNGTATRAVVLGEQLATLLVERGAARILHDIRLLTPAQLPLPGAP